MPVEILPLATPDDAHKCALLMSSSDPWKTLGRSYDQCLALVNDSTRETYVAYDGETFVGFIILNMRGAFVGYIQTVAVSPEMRGGGVGSQLVRFAEQRIFSEARNVFMCVSSFNPRARALYERLGYETVGELKDYIINGASEILLRKTTGPLLGR